MRALSNFVILLACLSFCVACADGESSESIVIEDPAKADELTETQPTTGVAWPGMNGDDPAPEVQPEQTPIDCQGADSVQGLGVTGRLYEDGIGAASSLHQPNSTDASTQSAGVSVNLLTSAGPSWSATTCADGDYGFPLPGEGTYVVEVPYSGAECRSRNCPKRLGQAIREGRIKMVTVGDSLPVVGGQPPFPDRLATLLSGVATVDNVNVAVPGARSFEWLPGSEYFNNRLAPQIADADLLVISLGGNDIVSFAYDYILGGGAFGGGDPLDAAKAEVSSIAANLIATLDAAEAINPDFDAVYVLYPNYGQATQTMPWNLVNGILGDDAMVELLDHARQTIPFDRDLILADLFAAFMETKLDNYLVDWLHFEDNGATIAAEAIFHALGGVHVGPSPFGNLGQTPIGLEHDYALTP